MLAPTSAAQLTAQATNPYENLIQQMLLVESQPRFTLEDSKFDLERNKSILSDLDTLVTDFDKILDTFIDPISHPFESRTVNTGDVTAFSATANGDASFGSHTLQVTRLASTDTRLSEQHTNTSTDIITAVGGGNKSFDISVASPTDVDPNNRETITVTANLTGSNDEEVLEEIATAINSAMAAAYSAGTIKTDERAIASVVSETSDTARLSIRAGQTGYSNRIDFVADTDGLLAALDINNAGLVAGTAGGQVSTVGTSEDTSDLTSKFDLDGLTLYRNSNQIDDAITGVTLTLKETSAGPADFTVSTDSDSIEEDITEFIDKYNEILSYIKTRSTVDADTGTRGAFANDPTFTSLRLNMRADLITQVTGQPANAPTQITEIGLEVASDGKLSIDDKDALIQAIETDPENIRTLFAGADGIAQRLSDRIADYMGFDGFITTRKNNLDTRIRNIDDRILRFDESLARREQQLRDEFNRLQEALAAFQGQQASLGAIG